MEQTLTAKVQIFPSPEEAELLLSSMKAYAAACDHVSRYIFATGDMDKVSVQKHTYSELRSRYALPSQMACNVVRTVLGAYRSNRKNARNWIFCRYRSPQMTLSWNRDYSLTSDRFSVGTLKGRIRVAYAGKGMEPYFEKEVYRFGTAGVRYRHGKYYLHISVTRELEEYTGEEENVVGIDRGIRFLATAYDSKGKTRFYDGKEIKQKRAHYKALRKELQQVGTPSSRRRLRKIGQRENRWMRDVDHQVSKALTVSHPEGTTFVLEDLKGVRTATERVRIKDRYVTVSWAYQDLEQKLIYKAARRQQRVIQVDPAYTSQRCPKCGHTEEGNRSKKLHLFCCRKCGYTSNDDRIAAMNLHRMGREKRVPGAVVAEQAL